MKKIALCGAGFSCLALLSARQSTLTVPARAIDPPPLSILAAPPMVEYKSRPCEWIYRHPASDEASDEATVQCLAVPWRAAVFFADGEPVVWPASGETAPIALSQVRQSDFSGRHFAAALMASAALATLAAVWALIAL